MRGGNHKSSNGSSSLSRGIGSTALGVRVFGFGLMTSVFAFFVRLEGRGGERFWAFETDFAIWR